MMCSQLFNVFMNKWIRNALANIRWYTAVKKIDLNINIMKIKAIVSDRENGMINS